MLTDQEAAEIRRRLDEGWRGPFLVVSLRRLLDDRERLVAQLREFQAATEPRGVEP